MMIGILDQFSFLQLGIGALLLMVAQIFVTNYFLKRLNSNPADPLETTADQDAEIVGDRPMASTVGTPRLRRLQPSGKTGSVTPGSTDATDERIDTPTSVPVGKIPVEKVDPPAGKTPGKAGEQAYPDDSGKPYDPYAPIPIAASEKSPSKPVEAVPLPLLAALAKAGPTTGKAPDTLVPAVGKANAPELVPAMSDKPPAAGSVPVPPGSLTAAPVAVSAPESSKDKTPAPPVSVPPVTVEHSTPVTVIPVPLVPAASLVEIPEKKPSGPVEPKKGEAIAMPSEPVPIAAIPRRQFVNPFEKPAAPVEATAEAETETAAAESISAQSQPEPVAATPKIEPVGDGIVAVSGPASLEAIDKTPEAVEAEESDDVKKRKTPKSAKPAPERSGLILIPPAAAEGDTKPVAVEPAEAPVEAKAGPPEGALTLKPASEPKIESFAPATPSATPPATKLIGRPRIFLPANAPATAAPKEEPAATPEVVTAKETSMPETPTPVAPVPEVVAVPEVKPEPEAEREPVVPVAEETPVLTEAKAASEPEKVEEPRPEEKPEPVAEKVAPEPVVEDFKVPDEPVASEPPPLPTPEPEPVAATIVPVDPIAAVPLVAEPASVVAEEPALPKPEEKVPPVAAEEPAPAAQEPVPVPLLPRTVPAPETSHAAALSLTPSASADFISAPDSVMPSTESTTSASATGRASAQLTLGFEITSLQLTPFFKLGAVQLRPLSNVVSLHLIGTQPENPLAAGISFQIDRVELEGSHIKSILLKLLGGAQPAATPQPKLQVNAVELTHASEGAPISITPSDQTSTAVQLLATFTIAAMDFTPSFEIGSLRLEPTSNQVMLRLAPSSRPAALDLPPSFDVATVEIGGDTQISAVRLTPSTPKAA